MERKHFEQGKGPQKSKRGPRLCNTNSLPSLYTVVDCGVVSSVPRGIFLSSVIMTVVRDEEDNSCCSKNGHEVSFNRFSSRATANVRDWRVMCCFTLQYYVGPTEYCDQYVSSRCQFQHSLCERLHNKPYERVISSKSKQQQQKLHFIPFYYFDHVGTWNAKLKIRSLSPNSLICKWTNPFNTMWHQSQRLERFQAHGRSPLSCPCAVPTELCCY